MNNIVGKDIKKVDVLDKVTGQARFANDIVFEELLHLQVLRAPYPHAKILKIDTTAAEEVAGVEKIVTAQDLPELNNFGLIVKDQQVLARDKVRYMGDALALIAAQSQKIAQQAKELIEVEYQELEVISDPHRALEEDAIAIHEGGNLLCSHNLSKGNLAQGFAEADLIITNQFQTQHLEQLPMEAEAGIAKYDREHDIYQLWVATQWLHDIQVDVAQALGVAPEQIEIIQPTIGGAFGKREDVSVHIHLALMAKATNKAVKLSYSREESMITQSKRHPITFKFKTGVTKEGKLTAWEAEVIGDTGACASTGPAVVHQALYHCTGPYNIEHVEGKSYTVYTNNTYAGAMRGFGTTQAAFAYESQLDLIAQELEMDPLDLRLKNAYELGSITPNGQVLTASVGLKESIEQAAKAFNYQKQLAAQQEFNAHSRAKKRGIGIASTMFGNCYGEGFPDHSLCEVEIKEQGVILIKSAAADLGQGVLTTVAQIVAEVLKVELDLIEFAPSSTELKNAGSSSASRQTIFSGNAAKLAAEKLLGKIYHYALLEFGLAYPEFEVKEGKLISHDGSVDLYLGELAQMLKQRGDTLAAQGCYFPQTIAPAEETGHSELNYLAYTFNTQLALVEVDLETGVVEVLKIVASPDIGKAINPQNVEGQSEGGMAMGLGMALLEEQIIEEGITLNPDLSGYLVLTAADIPEMETIIVESGQGPGPYGAKGIGEPAMLPTAPAIINAIDNAIGVRIKELPATPDKILAALANKHRG